MDTINLQIIRESFGRVAYSHKTHEKAAEIQENRANIVKGLNVVLTALTSTSILGDLISNQIYFQYISPILIVITLAFLIFQLSFNPGQQAEKHRQAAKELWFIRERHVNFLADIKNEKISENEIITYRDALLKELRLIYKFAPQTNSKAYKEAQKALKIDEELTFSDNEINNLLPKELHINTVKADKNN
jgi:hypothetical protein